MRKYNLKDLVGREFGFIRVISREDKQEDDTRENAKWRVLCACGKQAIYSHKTLTSNKKTNCGCGMRTSKYLPGSKFSMLTIVSAGPVHPSTNKPRVYCKCDCGNENLTLVQKNNLISGNTTSCGCVGIANRITHGKSSTRTYQIHEGMLRRCSELNKEDFPYHAGRGIKVCDEWNPKLGGCFENFFNDMGEAPRGMSLDRIDNNGNYCKDNCRWTTNSIQGYNKGLDPNNSSGKSGVSYYQRNKKWSAEIHVDNEHIRLGMFDLLEDAIKARQKAELEYYGWNKQ